MMFSAHMVTWISSDCMKRPSSDPIPIVSRVASRLSSIVGVMSVDPCMTPPARAITLWDTSNTALTMLNVLDSTKMAQAVLKIHLKKIQ